MDDLLTMHKVEPLQYVPHEFKELVWIEFIPMLIEIATIAELHDNAQVAAISRLCIRAEVPLKTSLMVMILGCVEPIRALLMNSSSCWLRASYLETHLTALSSPFWFFKWYTIPKAP